MTHIWFVQLCLHNTIKSYLYTCIAICGLMRWWSRVTWCGRDNRPHRHSHIDTAHRHCITGQGELTVTWVRGELCVAVDFLSNPGKPGPVVLGFSGWWSICKTANWIKWCSLRMPDRSRARARPRCLNNISIWLFEIHIASFLDIVLDSTWQTLYYSICTPSRTLHVEVDLELQWQYVFWCLAVYN